MNKLIGTIIKDTADKTVTVSMTQMHRHPLYHRAYPSTSKILVHDEKNEGKIGDVVEIVSVRPISKNKSWKLGKKLQ